MPSPPLSLPFGYLRGEGVELRISEAAEAIKPRVGASSRMRIISELKDPAGYDDCASPPTADCPAGSADCCAPDPISALSLANSSSTAVLAPS
jgi:hypothetical protein